MSSVGFPSKVLVPYFPHIMKGAPWSAQECTPATLKPFRIRQDSAFYCLRELPCHTSTPQLWGFHHSCRSRYLSFGALVMLKSIETQSYTVQLPSSALQCGSLCPVGDTEVHRRQNAGCNRLPIWAQHAARAGNAPPLLDDAVSIEEDVPAALLVPLVQLLHKLPVACQPGVLHRAVVPLAPPRLQSRPAPGLALGSGSQPQA